MRSLVAGFSLIELMMTLAIMAVLAMVSIPMAQTAVQRGKEQELRRALMQIREAIDAHKRAADLGHVELRVGGSGYPRSLADLVEGVPDQKSPQHRRMYFLRALPSDPMKRVEGRPPEDIWGLRSYASSSHEPKSGADVFDVYSLSDGVGLNGVPYRQW